MLIKAQKEYLIKSIGSFAESLSQEQCKALYFRLDDILQYGSESVPLMYEEVYRVLKQKRRRR